MNRTIIVGISLFFAILAIAVMGDQNEATADWGCFGCYGDTCDCQGCDGVACYSCIGVAQPCHGACYGYSSSAQHSHRPLASLFRHSRRDDGYTSCDCSCVGVPTCSSYFGDCYGVAIVEPVTTATYVLETDVTPLPAEPAPTPAESDTTMRGRAIINVHVPAGAKVFENGRATFTTGTNRRYEAVDLKPGTLYRYAFRAELNEDRKLLAQTKVILVQSGQSVDVTFDLNADGVVSSRQLNTPVWRQ